MKHVKKFLAVLLTLAMTLAMTATVFADEDATTTANVTITGSSSTQTYKAYQIFTGDISGEQLTNIKWGNGITDAGKKALLEKAGLRTADSTADVTEQDAAKLADYLSNQEDDDTVMRAIADVAGMYTQNGTDTTALAPGYYLFASDAVADDQAATRFILKVVGEDMEVSPKSATVPTPAKTVDDTDADINQTLTYTISATLPADYDDYKVYHLTMTDTMSSGITFDEIVSVTYGTTAIDTDEYTTNEDDIKDEAGKTLTVDFANLKHIDAITNSTVITVTYHAHLNENAVIAQDGNPNTLQLTYTNNPNYYGEQQPGDDNPPTPDEPGEPGDNEPTQNSEEVKVTVYTYALAIQKVDENNNPLAGATFTVPWVVTGSNGVYTVDASQTGTTTISTDDNGLATIKGMASGDYKVQEAEAPDGYNAVTGDIDVTAAEISSTTTTTTTKTFYDADGNVISTTTYDEDTTTYTDASIVASVLVVVNHSGSVLPSTGGIGTTIFYVAGMILVLGAGVVLVARKRIAR